MRLKRLSENRAVFCWLLAVIFYCTDCAGASKEHPDVPWIESGVYAGGLFGFFATIAMVFVGFVILIIGKDGKG
jgi:hypothetical protein